MSDMQLDPRTGGEKYNGDLIRALECTGVVVDRIDGGATRRACRLELLLPLALLLKSIGMARPDYCVFDVGFSSKCLLALLWLHMARGVPLVAVLLHYNYLTKRLGVKRLTLYLLEVLLSRLSCMTVTISEYNRRVYLENCPGNKPVHLIPPVVHVQQPEMVQVQHGGSTGLRLLTVGNVDVRKNLETTLEGLARATVPWEWCIAGRHVSPRVVGRVRARATALGLVGRVHFLGRVDDQEIVRRYVESDVFILVSNMEGYGMAYAEAMAFGLPVVAGRAGAVPEIVADGETGILCQPDSAPEIARAVERLANCDTRRRMSLASHASYRRLPTQAHFDSRVASLVADLQRAPCNVGHHAEPPTPPSVLP